MIFTPSLAKISSNARVSLVSRLRMKKRTAAILSPEVHDEVPGPRPA